MTTTQTDLIEVPALFTLDGALASTHYGWGPLGDHGHFGPYWRLTDTATAAYGKRYVYPSTATKRATRERNMRAKGFRVGTVQVSGTVEVVEVATARIATAA